MERVLCKTCNLMKEDDYFRKRPDSTNYENCVQCYKEESAKFWADKRFKTCATCKTVLPLRKYDFMADFKIPFRNCRKCFEESVANSKEATGPEANFSEFRQDVHVGKAPKEPRSAAKRYAPYSKAKGNDL